MPNCDCYAIGSEFTRILEAVFAQGGWQLYELNSRPDQPLRRFNSTTDLAAAFDLGTRDSHFQLYTPSMGGGVLMRRIELHPGAVAGASHRFAAEGYGLIQLYFGSLQGDGILSRSHTNHFSEKRAKAAAEMNADSGSPAEWDWTVVLQTSRRLVRMIRSLAVSADGPRLVLPEAKAAVDAGHARLR